MKKHSILFIALAAFALSSCKDEWVSIDSLQVFADEVYQGQEVDLGMSVSTSNGDDNYYEWFCDEGSLRTAQQGYTVMKWRAPRRSGEFTVGCTVHTGKAKETRTAVIKVTGLFFDRFSGTSSGWSTSTFQGTSTAALRSGRLESRVTAGNVLDSLGYVYRGIGSSFFPPASVTAQTAIVDGTTNVNDPKYPVTPYVPTWDNFMGFGLTNGYSGTGVGNDPGPELSPLYFISEVRVDWWPTTHMQNSVAYYSATDDPMATNAPSTINAADFNARIAVRWTWRQYIDQENPDDSRAAQSGWFMDYVKADALTYEPGVYKNVGIAIDEDYKVIVAVDGAEAFTSHCIQTWKAKFDPNAQISVSQMRYYFPNFTMVSLDDVVANNEAEFRY